MTAVASRDPRPAAREHAQRLVARAAYLRAADRALIEHVYDRGLSVAQLARAAGRPARPLQRRLAAIVTRMRHPLFRFLVEKPDLVPADTRTVAQLWAFEHVPLRRIAVRLDLSLHTVRLLLRDATTLARLWGYR